MAHNYVFFYFNSIDKIKRLVNFAILFFFANTLPQNLAALDNHHFIISPCGGVGIWAIPLQLVTSLGYFGGFQLMAKPVSWVQDK